MTIKSEFRKWQKNNYNFMTPDMVKLWQRKSYVVELSRGSGFSGEIWGVTIAKREGKRDFNTSRHRYSELNQSFSTKSDAVQYIKGTVLKEIG